MLDLIINGKPGVLLWQKRTLYQLCGQKRKKFLERAVDDFAMWRAMCRKIHYQLVSLHNNLIQTEVRVALPKKWKTFLTFLVNYFLCNLPRKILQYNKMSKMSISFCRRSLSIILVLLLILLSEFCVSASQDVEYLETSPYTLHNHQQHSHEIFFASGHSIDTMSVSAIAAHQVRSVINYSYQ